MKKIFALMALMVLAILLVMPLVALAEATTPPAGQPYDWAQLATIPGAIAATLLIAQYLKLPLDKVWKIPTRAFVFGIAFVLMFAAKAATEPPTLQAFGLIIINTFVVALAAMGAYELSYAKKL